MPYCILNSKKLYHRTQTINIVVFVICNHTSTSQLLKFFFFFTYNKCGQENLNLDSPCKRIINTIKLQVIEKS